MATDTQIMGRHEFGTVAVVVTSGKGRRLEIDPHNALSRGDQRPAVRCGGSKAYGRRDLTRLSHRPDPCG